MTVAAAITAADLSEFDVYAGDCVNIAIALQTVFGGEYVASYANQVDFEQAEPAHVAVRIDGQLYDGGGVTSTEALRERAHYGVSGQSWDDIVVSKIREPSDELHTPARVSDIVERLETATRANE